MGAWLVIATVSFIVAFFAMIGYPALLAFLDKVKKIAPNIKDSTYEPMVSYLIVAHNEEAVIENKLKNALTLDYPCHKFQIVVASDYSTDRTNEIVENFIVAHPELTINLYKTMEHKGKTNAQNEAQKITTGEILVMTDANAELKENAIKELVSYFTSEDISYVCGRLVYSNNYDNKTSESESTYWDLELKMRDIESRIQTITAGNGSIYAVRNKDYIDIPLIGCHDSAMPYLYALDGKRALFNPDAISYEKAGEENQDEFKRKIRMNREILDVFVNAPRAMNIVKYRWFSLFYFGHRVCRYLLWLMHILFFVSSVALTIITHSLFWSVVVGMQIFAVVLGVVSINKTISNKLLRFVGYYAMTVLAQVIGAYRQATGQSKPFWEKAESTR